MTPPTGPGSFVDDAHRYRLESRIATGGMGVVWRATDTTLHRDVAIKVLKAEYADNADFRARFATEAQHAAALHHPGIASVYDFGEAHPDDGSGAPLPYLVMELVDGRPLSDLLRAGEPLDPDATRDLLAQAAAALGAAHAAGIVHRDVKPANLLVTPDRRIKITDFGIARASDSVGLTQTGQVMGTPQYLSPEQARGEVATPASDVYSLGVVAFECLTGHRPFQADTPVATALAHLREPVPELPATVPPALAHVVRRALEKDPAARFPDGAAFAAALRDPEAADATQVAPLTPAEGQTQVLSTGAAPLAPPTRATSLADPDETAQAEKKRRFPWVPVLAVVLLVALGVLLFVLLGGGDDADSPENDRPTRPTTSATREPTRGPSPTERPTPTESETETSAPPTSAPPTTEAPPTPDTVEVVAGNYVGRSVGEVEAALRGLGLEVTLVAIDNPGDRTEETVESVSPSGDVERGSLVTVRYWGAPPATTPTQTPRTTSPSAPTGDTTEPSEGGTTG